MIVDVKKKELSLNARDVRMDNAPRENPLKAATTILIGLVCRNGRFFSTVPLAAVSGGPKTPCEQSAVRFAIAKAIEPWLALHPYNKKIDTGDEREEDIHENESGSVD